ncbi:MAG: hypothetical protein CL910_06505 [Deltaproteobacteria bacterium]|jgi:hypothetical protein|nr:hypothetical protein [Deltaproteobacteria bacterium]
MKWQAWLIVAFAALFGLRAPLCAHACLDAVPAVALATAEPHPSGPGSCHQSEQEAPEAPQPGDHSCDCDGAQLAAAKSDAKKGSATSLVPVAPTAAASFSISGARRLPPELWRRHASLPSPDILVLNSTLLL